MKKVLLFAAAAFVASGVFFSGTSAEAGMIVTNVKEFKYPKYLDTTMHHKDKKTFPTYLDTTMHK